MTMSRRDSQSGITLIEMLVVLAVIGVGAGATMMSLGGDRSGAETQAVRLARNLSLGVDEAMISGLPLALRWDARGYAFVQMPATGKTDAPDKWPATRTETLGTRHDLGGSLRMSAQGTAETPLVIISAGAATQPITFDITGSGAGWSVVFDGFSADAQVAGEP